MIENLRKFRHNKDVGYFEIDAISKQLVFVNEKLMQLVGWSDYQNILGVNTTDFFKDSTFLDLFEEDSSKHIVEQVIECVIGNKTCKFFVNIKRDNQKIYGVLIEVLNREVAELASKLDTIVDITKHLVFIKDREFKYTLVSKTSDTIFNMPCDHVIGLTDYDFLPKEKADKYRQGDLIALEAGQFEITELDNDKLVHIIKKRILTPDGELIGIAAIVIEIPNGTEETIADDIFASQQVGVFCLTFNGAVSNCNEAAAKMIGMDSAIECIGLQDISKLIINPDQLLEIQQGISENKRIDNFEIAIKTKDVLQPRWLRVSIRSASCGYRVICIDITRDIIEREEHLSIIKARNEEIEKANNILFEVNSMNYILLKEKPSWTQLELIIKRFTGIINANRGYLFERITCGQDAGCRYEVKFESIKNHMTSLKNVRPYCINCGNHNHGVVNISKWCELIEKNTTIVDSSSKLASDFLGYNGSICIIPIFSHEEHDRCWGFLGFDDDNSRLWGATEVKALQCLAAVISFAIERIHVSEENKRYNDIFQTEIAKIREIQQKAMSDLNEAALELKRSFNCSDCAPQSSKDVS